MERLWTKSFFVVSLANFLIYIVYYSLMVIIAVYAMEQLNGSASQAGLAAGIFLVAGLLARIVTGRLIEQVGKMKILYLGVIIYFSALLLYFSASTVYMLCAVRFLQGTGFGIATTAMATIVANIIPHSRQGEGIGYFLLSVTIASAVGPLIGIYIYQYSGFLPVLYLSIMLTAVTFFVSLFLKVPENKLDGKQIKENGHGIHGYIEFKALPIAVIGFIVFFSYSSIISFFSSYAAYLQQMDAGRFFFFVYSVAIMVSRPLTGKISDVKGNNFVMYPSFIFFAIGLAVMSQAHDGFILLLSAIFMGLGFGTFASVGQAVAIKSLPKQRMGVATSTYMAISEMGIGIGPFLLGVLLPAIGFRALYLLMAVIVILAMLPYYFVYSKRKETSALN